jgi:hypothetical protein
LVTTGPSSQRSGILLECGQLRERGGAVLALVGVQVDEADAVVESERCVSQSRWRGLVELFVDGTDELLVVLDLGRA